MRLILVIVLLVIIAVQLASITQDGVKIRPAKACLSDCPKCKCVDNCKEHLKFLKRPLIGTAK